VEPRFILTGVIVKRSVSAHHVRLINQLREGTFVVGVPRWLRSRSLCYWPRSDWDGGLPVFIRERRRSRLDNGGAEFRCLEFAPDKRDRALSETEPSVRHERSNPASGLVQVALSNRAHLIRVARAGLRAASSVRNRPEFRRIEPQNFDSARATSRSFAQGEGARMQ